MAETQSSKQYDANGIHISRNQLLQILMVSIIGILIGMKYPRSVQEAEPFIKEMIFSFQNITNQQIDKFNKSYMSLRPSQLLLSQTHLSVHEKHPIIMIPGLSSTPLVLWRSKKHKTKSADTQYFYKKCSAYIERTLRQTIWGSAQCAVEMARDTNCWLLSMMLNETTGLDSSYTKVRSAEGGTASIDYLFPLVWVWAPIINNIAEIGYDSNLFYVATYDWRLSFKHLEKRDLYFTRLKHEIQLRVLLNKEKAVIIGHSMGGNVAMYFLQWINAQNKEWVDKYIESILLLAAPMLGVPKYVSMSLSGECLETLLLPEAIAYVKEWIVPRPYFNRFARSVQSAMYLQPIGGTKIWGNDPLIKWVIKHGTDHDDEDICDDHAVDEEYDAFDKIMNKPLTEKQERIISRITRKNYTADDWLKNTIKKIDKRAYGHIYGLLENGFPDEDIDISDDTKYGNDRYFGNALWRPLPNAPNMKIYCMYGVDLQAETAYYYERDYNASFKYPFRIDSSVQIKSEEELVVNGVRMSDGDGTVPLMSLGFMCAKGWREQRWNPHGVKIKTVEYRNEDQSFIYKGTVRGGAKSGEHLDILGNGDMIKNILLVASGNGNQVKETVYSNIHRIVNDIKLK